MGRVRLGLLVLFAVISAAAAAAMPAAPEVEAEAEEVGQLLTNLFVTSREARDMELEGEVEQEEVEDVSYDLEDEVSVLDAAEAKAEARMVEVDRFNSYIDAIYRRMNAALRAKMMDPMQLNLDEKKKGDKAPKRMRRDVEEDEEDDLAEEDVEEGEMADTDVLESRMGKAGRKNKQKQKNSEAEESSKGKKKGKGKKKEEREAAKKRKQRQKAKKQAEREKRREEKKNKKAAKTTRESRSGPKKKNKGKKNKQNKNSKAENNKRNNNKKNTKNKKNNKESSKTHRSRSNSPSKARAQEEKMLGSLSGIATLRREGDVMVKDEDNHKIVVSEFSVGPLQLEVSKVYGKGKARTIKSAKAITDVMSGTMTLKVKPDGTAHVKKVVFKEPENVDVKGSLSNNKPRTLRTLKNSVNKMRPLAAIRILKTARYVLKSPSAGN